MQVWELREFLKEIKNPCAKIGIIDEAGNIQDITFVWSEEYQAFVFGYPI